MGIQWYKLKDLGPVLPNLGTPLIAKGRSRFLCYTTMAKSLGSKTVEGSIHQPFYLHSADLHFPPSSPTSRVWFGSILSTKETPLRLSDLIDLTFLLGMEGLLTDSETQSSDLDWHTGVNSTLSSWSTLLPLRTAKVLIPNSSNQVDRLLGDVALSWHHHTGDPLSKTKKKGNRSSLTLIFLSKSLWAEWCHSSVELSKAFSRPSKAFLSARRIEPAFLLRWASSGGFPRLSKEEFPPIRSKGSSQLLNI